MKNKNNKAGKIIIIAIIIIAVLLLGEQTHMFSFGVKSYSGNGANFYTLAQTNLTIGKAANIFVYIPAVDSNWYSAIYTTDAPAEGTPHAPACNGVDGYVGTWTTDNFYFMVYVNGKQVEEISKNTDVYYNPSYLSSLDIPSYLSYRITHEVDAEDGYDSPSFYYGDWYDVPFVPNNYGNYTLQIKLYAPLVENCGENNGVWSYSSRSKIYNITPVITFDNFEAPINNTVMSVPANTTSVQTNTTTITTKNTTITITPPERAPSFDLNNIIGSIQTDIQNAINSFLKML